VSAVALAVLGEAPWPARGPTFAAAALLVLAGAALLAAAGYVGGFLVGRMRTGRAARQGVRLEDGPAPESPGSAESPHARASSYARVPPSPARLAPPSPQVTGVSPLASPVGVGQDPLEKIAKLKRLLDADAITKDEFEKCKAELMQRL